MANVLLTGGTGFIGSRTLRYALEKGYHVRATVRSEAKAQELKLRLSQHSDKLETIIVPDILAPGAFDKAVEGVEFVVHVASPLPSGTLNDDQEALTVQPSIRGTTGILESSQKPGTVKRVVITSSLVAVVPLGILAGIQSPGDKVYTAEDRAPDVPKPYPNVFAAYIQSKIAAQKASDAWMAEHKPSFDLINIQPSFVGGVSDIAKKSADLLEGTNPYFLAPIRGKDASAAVGAQVANFVDVDDVAKAHIEALNSSVKGNQDFVLTNKGGDEAWNDAKAVVSKHFPETVGKLWPNDGSIEPHFFAPVDIEKTEATFGKLNGLDKIVEKLVRQYVELAEKE